MAGFAAEDTSPQASRIMRSACRGVKFGVCLLFPSKQYVFAVVRDNRWSRLKGGKSLKGEKVKESKRGAGVARPE